MKFTLSSPDTLLISSELFKNRMTQIVTSIILLAALGIQIYLFVGLNNIVDEMLSA